MDSKQRLPDYVTIIGEGTEVIGEVRFCGGIHIDGTVVGDVRGQSEEGCALTLSQSGTIEGSLDVAHVVIDGLVIGDVRASRRAELASGARIEGNLHYGALAMDVGAKVNGKLLALDEVVTPQVARSGASDSPDTELTPVEDAEAAESSARDGAALDNVRQPGDGHT